MKPYQVGILVPWVNTAMEEEIPLLVNPAIGLHWMRVRPTTLPIDGHDTSYLKGLLEGMPSALTGFDGLNLQLIMFGCTSASVLSKTIGPVLPSNYQDAALWTAMDSLVYQLNRLNAESITLFAPYENAVLNSQARMLEESGIRVRKTVQIYYQSEIRHISTNVICDALSKELKHQDDVAVISCTALHTLAAVRRLRVRFDVKMPLITSNTAIAFSLNDFFNLPIIEVP